MSTYPKGDKSTNNRSTKPRKRKFHRNRFTSEVDNDECNTSSSAKKLSTADSENITIHPAHCYRIVEFMTVFLAISEIVICRSCKQKITFAEKGHRGLGFKIVLLCMCGQREINSGPLINTGYEINRRIVLVMRLLGVGREGIVLFCGLMDLCQGLARSTYDNIVTHLYSASKSMFESVSKKAVKEEQEKNVQNGQPGNCLKVSGDGSWKKRGYTSLFGVTTLIGHYSGKVVDLIVKSAYCHACALHKSTLDDAEFEEWYEDHKKSCSSNHDGSAGKMEVDSIVEMFLRSVEKFGVKYTNYIGDGDSKTYAGIQSFNATVWRTSPKHLNSGGKNIEISSYMAAGIFNEGYSSVLNTMELFGLKIGQTCKMFADNVDAQRIKKGNERTSFASKEARTARRLEQLQQNEFFEEAEGSLYGAGIAN